MQIEIFFKCGFKIVFFNNWAFYGTQKKITASFNVAYISVSHTKHVSETVLRYMS